MVNGRNRMKEIKSEIRSLRSEVKKLSKQSASDSINIVVGNKSIKLPLNKI